MGIKKLPQELLPKDVELMKWFGYANICAQRNQKLCAQCAQLTDLLAKDGYCSVIMKGQSNAVYYPHPEMRSPGDIDIWVVSHRLTAYSESK